MLCHAGLGCICVGVHVVYRHASDVNRERK
nr:MAG TPA: hypothetical protein [Caudoviricetes sp.]